MAEVGEQKAAAASVRARGLEPGVLIDEKLQIDDYLGSGGMCDVYRATHLILQKSVAIKFLKPRLAGDSQNIKRFEREAILLSKLSHPNLVEIFAIGVFDGRPYIAMELMEGRSLAQLLSAAPEGRLSAATALPIFCQICEALTAAHTQGIVHRDLKPSNVMLVDNDSLVKVMDFGIAKVLPESGTEIQKLTQTGDLIGSIPYMSPEQCLGEKVDERSDIYSLGCLMYETLTGKLPFTGNAPLVVLKKHIEEKVDCPAALDNPLGRVVLRAMSKSPADRPASAAALADLLSHPPPLPPKPRQLIQVSKMVLPLAIMVAFGWSIFQSAQLHSVDRDHKGSSTNTANVPSALPSGTTGDREDRPALWMNRRLLDKFDSHEANDARAERKSAEELYEKLHGKSGALLLPDQRQEIFAKTYRCEIMAADTLLHCRNSNPEFRREALDAAEHAAQFAKENNNQDCYLLAISRKLEALEYVPNPRPQQAKLAQEILNSPQTQSNRALYGARLAAFRFACAGKIDNRDAAGCYKLALEWLDFMKRTQPESDSFHDCYNYLGAASARLQRYEESIHWYKLLSDLPRADRGLWFLVSSLGIGEDYYYLSTAATGAQKKKLLDKCVEYLDPIAGVDGSNYSTKAKERLQQLHRYKGP